jgi:hypothetical protein
MSAFGGKADVEISRRMSGSDLAAAYRLHAAHCVDLAHRASDGENRLLFLAMAQAWQKLAEQAIKNSETVLVYETPVPSGP